MLSLRLQVEAADVRCGSEAVGQAAVGELTNTVNKTVWSSC